MYNYYIKDRIYQGDIFKDIEIKLDFEIVGDNLHVKTRYFPYVIVMTQDCDLEQDFNNRKKSSDNQSNCILSILLCPVFSADDYRAGNHLKNAGLEIKNLNSGLWKPIIKNKEKRYYFLDTEVVDVDYKEEPVTVPNFLIDFKHYQTIQRDELYNKLKDHYYMSIDPPYREKISDRFTHYLGRIGLPEADEKSGGYNCGASCHTD